MGEANFYYFTCLKRKINTTCFIPPFNPKRGSRAMSALGARSLLLLRGARNSMAVVGRRNLHVETEGIPGSFLPFDINRWSYMGSLIRFTLYVSSGFNTAFIMVWHLLKKKSGA